MLEQLPVELLVKTLKLLPAQDRARFERVNAYCKAVARSYAWDHSAYEGYQHDAIDATPYRSKSDAWKALCRERRQMERTMAPLMRPGRFRLTPGWPPREALARLYIEEGLHQQAVVALGDAPAYPRSRLLWLSQLQTAQHLAGRPDVVQELQGVLDAHRSLGDAIRADDVSGAQDALGHGARLEGPELQLAVNQAIFGQSAVFTEACKMIAHAGTQAAFVGAGFDPVQWAVNAGAFPVIDTLVANGFAVSGPQLETLVRTCTVVDLQRLLNRQAFAPEDLLPALSATCYDYGLPQRTEVLCALTGAGVDVNALLPAHPIRVQRYQSPTGRRLPPLLAALTQRHCDILPFISHLFACGADPRAVQAETGGNAWHFLVAGNVNDVDGVGRWLQAQNVPLDVLDRHGVTPLGAALTQNPNHVPLLLGLGAQVTGEHGTRRGKAVGSLELALDNEYAAPQNILPLIVAGAPASPRAWRKAVDLASADPLQALLERGGVSRRAVDGAFARLLPQICFEGVPTKLDLLVRHGANVNFVGKPQFRGSGKRRLHHTYEAAAPGLWPSAALPLARRVYRALPVLKKLRTLGVDLHATGPNGTNLWHALALTEPQDAAQVAAFLLRQGVDANAAARTAAGGQVTPLAWAEVHGEHAALLEALQDAAANRPHADHASGARVDSSAAWPQQR
ncbi:MAG TPA: hypothetical protein VFH51_08890 [Myxococcota bacterium]|nr:hypothetical protein [Myxococcota bacterium]